MIQWITITGPDDFPGEEDEYFTEMSNGRIGVSYFDGKEEGKRQWLKNIKRWLKETDELSFTLEQMKDCWGKAYSAGFFELDHNYERQTYFKEQFNITL